MAQATRTPIAKHLGDEAEDLLDHECETIPKDQIHLPGPDFVDRVWKGSDRSPQVLRSMQQIFNHGRLGGSGYISILPVDQGIEHSAGVSFAPNPMYFDPENIVKLAIEGGCNAVATTYGVLGSVARDYAHKIPFVLKINHSELLSYPNRYDQVPYARVEDAYEQGCVGVGATIYWGSEESNRQLQEISKIFSRAHELGMTTILWCYVRNKEFVLNGSNYEAVRDHKDEGYAKDPSLVDEKLLTDHPIDMTRYQVANNYMGRCGLINSGGASGENDLQQVVRTAVINKRAGGMGLITGRKSFQKPMEEGVEILNAIQDVYLDDDITIA